MLLDVTCPKHVSLGEYENQIVLSINVRTWELEDDYPSSSLEQGQEGVWYRSDSDPYFQPLTPLVKTPEESCYGPRQLFYCLNVEPSVKEGEIKKFHFLVRWWDSNVYAPHMKSEVYELVGYGHEGGPTTWAPNTDNLNLYGFSFI